MNKNNRWKMNRIGFINFWLYDEEIFDLSDGKILIRGTNGSGKSITTQSIVSFILDGNRSPERLDTFGSNDRKMEYYFLGDGEKEDETGYIFLELKKENVEQYITIGIGQRARRGKPMDFWGFVLTDGRRIGEDFKLYREVGSKRIPLSKNELERILGEKNQIVYGQKDYMELVNKELFGFTDINYYKKLIKFLLKIRTSKLSTDIKPVDVQKILNDSLQVLEERDLRVLVDSLEKMDNMQKLNEIQKEAQKHLLIIKKEYDKYNKFVLVKKATTYFEAEKEYIQLKKTIEKFEKEINDLIKKEKEDSESKILKTKRLEEVEQEIRLLDSIDLKKYVNELTFNEQELKAKEQEISFDEEKLDRAKDELRKYGTIKRNEEKQISNFEYQIKKQYQEMNEINDTLLFDIHIKNEGELFDSEISQKIKRIKSNLEVYHKNIKLGLEILKAFKILEEELDIKEQELNVCSIKYENVKDELIEASKMETQARDNLTEEFYILKERNEFLKISKNDLENIVNLIKKYDGLIEAGEIKKILEKNYNLKLEDLNQEKNEYKYKKITLEKDLEKEKTELEILKNMPEKIPERTLETIKCREQLKNAGINFISLYEGIDFAENISETEKNILETQLKDMKILDALVIPYSEQEKARNILENYSDLILRTKRFLVSSDKNQKFNKLVIPENSNISVELREVIENFIENISINNLEDELILMKNGYFRNGVLEGYSSKNQEACFIGVQRRKEKLEKDILEKKIRHQELEDEINNFVNFIEDIDKQISILKKEYENVPKYTNLDTAIKLKKDTEYSLKKLEIELAEKQNIVNSIKIKHQECHQQIIVKCRLLPFAKRIDEYEEAKRAAEEYEKAVYELENLLGLYENSKFKLKHIEETEEKQNELLESYYDKINKNKVQLEKIKIVIEKLRKILDSPENIAVAEKMEKLQKEVINLKTELDELKINIISLSKDISYKEDILKIEKEKISEKERNVKTFFNYLEEELSLKYVFENDEFDKISLENLINTLKEKNQKEKSITSVDNSLRNVFDKNASTLYEYMASVEEIFENDSLFFRSRLCITMVKEGKKLSLYEFEHLLREEIEQRELAIKNEDKKLIFDVLSGNIGHKLNDLIYEGKKWIKEMSKIMQEMDTSMKMKFQMEWKPKERLNESEIEINELQKLLDKNEKLLSAEDMDKLSSHFKNKLELVRQEVNDTGGELSYADSIKKILDYRDWFEFKLYFQKHGENKKELTNNAFNRFSGGEKAMSIYIPLLAAASAQYKKAKEDCPRIIALDEAFAGIDDRNISSMFELINKLDFDYIMNSQILWGCYDTVKNLRIAELVNRRDLKMVTVNRFLWDGKQKHFEI